MKDLNLERLNVLSPYEIKHKEGRYVFYTDFEIVYSVEFERDETYDAHPVYWLSLTNQSSKPSPNDARVKETIVCIIEEFFRQNTAVLLYMCDSANDQQAMRNRLFLRWFNGYHQRQKYHISTATMKDEGQEIYVALMVSRLYPQLEEITVLFNREIDMFRANKP